MTVAELLAQLADAGPAQEPGGRLVALDDGRLEYRGPRDALTDELRTEIRTRKAEIVQWLQTGHRDLPAQDLVALGYSPNLEVLGPGDEL